MAREKNKKISGTAVNHGISTNSGHSDWQRDSISTGSLVFASLLLLISPMGFCDETYFIENFDKDKNSLAENWILQDPNIGTLTVRDGYLLMNLTQKEYSPGYLGEAMINTLDDRLKFMGIEMKLRCSSDNKLNSDIGGGSRGWGFGKKTGNYGGGFFRLCFVSNSVDADWGPKGFSALSLEAGQVLFSQSIQGVDICEWHTYTILWRPENATFLLDGVVVAATTNVYNEGLYAFIKVDIDIMQDGRWVPEYVDFPCESVGQDEVCTDDYIQVDYVRIFIEEDLFKEMESEVLELLSHIQKLIENLDQKKENTTRLWMDYTESQNNWQNNRYYSEQDYQYLENIIICIENWDEVITLFSRATDQIKSLEQVGKSREAIIAKGDFSRAEETWEKYDYITTKTYLQKILDKPVEIPETVLLPILCFVLLSVLLREHAQS
jgi:hypothetical protein